MRHTSLYINDLNNSEEFGYLENIYNKINNDPKRNISVFFNNIGKHLHDLNIAYFPATNLWNFDGEIFVFRIEDAILCNNIVNNIKVNYIFGVENIEPYKLFILLTTLKDCNIYSYSEFDKNEVKRLLNKEAKVL